MADNELLLLSSGFPALRSTIRRLEWT